MIPGKFFILLTFRNSGFITNLLQWFTPIKNTKTSYAIGTGVSLWGERRCGKKTKRMGIERRKIV
jgi:hypothetical protein